MSIATYAEVRLALQEAADVLSHPFKGPVTKKGMPPRPARFGSPRGGVLYTDNGEVAVAVDGRFYVARGPDHETSAFALARFLHLKVERRKESGQVVIPDVGVQVDELDAGWFWLLCNPEGREPQGS